MSEPVSSPEALGSRIKTARRAQRVRQEDLAATVGSSHRFLRDLERGDASQIQRLFAVLAELGLKLAIDVPPAPPSRPARGHRS